MRKNELSVRTVSTECLMALKVQRRERRRRENRQRTHMEGKWDENVTRLPKTQSQILDRISIPCNMTSMRRNCSELFCESLFGVSCLLLLQFLQVTSSTFSSRSLFNLLSWQRLNFVLLLNLVSTLEMTEHSCTTFSAITCRVRSTGPLTNYYYQSKTLVWWQKQLQYSMQFSLPLSSYLHLETWREEHFRRTQDHDEDKTSFRDRDFPDESFFKMLSLFDTKETDELIRDTHK